MNFKHVLLGSCFILLSPCIQAQGIVGKLKQKAEQAAEGALDKKINEKSGNQSSKGNDSSSGNTSSGNSAGKPSNKGGSGLITTPPDVIENIADAEASLKTKSYGEARHAVQQAILGIELEIGNQVLKSLPETVTGLPYEKAEDRVTSTGWGWAGLTIERVYQKSDQYLKVTIANNNALINGVNFFLANGGYAQTTGGEQNWKQTKVKGHRGVIEYDEYDGYKLSVPMGQTSILMWEAVNFSSEQDVMKAANAFDIDGLIKTLGEKK